MCHSPQQPIRFLYLLLFTLLLSISTAWAQDGEALFKQNCATCHSMGSNKLTGPGMEGVMQRVPSEEWLFKWIKNNEAVRKSGDAYGIKIYEEYNKAQMTVFDNLKDEEVNAIIEYIKNPPAKKQTASTPGAGTGDTGLDDASDAGRVSLILISIAILLAILYYVLKGVKKSLDAIVRERKGLPPAPEYGAVEGAKIWALNNKKWVAVIVLVLVAWGSKVGWDALAGIGIYQGYAPEQPIHFSHKIHAGENAISCVYCHSSADKGKAAGVPSLNVCMNCHKGIQEGATTGKDEIAKIYKALDYDVNTQQYGNNPQPIRWVRVHSLPDHAYFNHSQHVVVGKQECQTCHGPVQEMDVIRQHSELTMGWCINCHRTTKVAMEGNGYYDELHKKLAEQYKGQEITVSKIGGIECARCHY